MMHRNNGNVFLNNYGEQLIQFFIASKLKVLIIRTRRDVQGTLYFPWISGFQLQKLFSKQT